VVTHSGSPAAEKEVPASEAAQHQEETEEEGEENEENREEISPYSKG
jgi:hypothetical protein